MIRTVREEKIMKKKVILLVAILTLICGCGKTIPKLDNGKEAVVTFKDGSMISIDDYYNELKNSYGTDKVIAMIDKKILEDKYKDKLDDAEEYAKNRIESLKGNFKDADGNYDEDRFISAIQQAYGFSTIEEFQEIIEMDYLREEAIKDYTASTITDKEIEKYYDDEIVGDREILHILITPEVKDSMTDDEKKEAEKAAETEAKAVITKLKKGEKFEDLAKEYSDDEATKEKGGSLGEINKGTYESDEFDKEAFSLKVGDYSKKPVKTTKGYEVIYVKEEKDKKPLKDVKEDIIETLRDEKLEEDATLQVTGITELRKEYGVEIIDTDVNRNYERYVEKLNESALAQNAEKNEKK